jgi:hypothetical protein
MYLDTRRDESNAALRFGVGSDGIRASPSPESAQARLPHGGKGLCFVHIDQKDGCKMFHG